MLWVQMGTDLHIALSGIFFLTSQINEVIRIISLRIRVRMKGTVGLE